MTTVLLLGVFLALLACSAFFSSAETAYFSVDPIQLRRIGEKHPATAERLRALLAAPGFHTTASVKPADLTRVVRFGSTRRTSAGAAK